MMVSGTCLVTGGAGFIGCALSDSLVRHFESVVAVDNLHPQVHSTNQRPSALHQDVELIVGDVTDADMWNSVLSRFQPTTVIHLAAETGTGQSLTESSRHVCVNLMGTSAMLDAFVRNSTTPEHFLLTSSRAIYGEGLWLDSNGRYVSPGLRTKSQLESGMWDFSGLVFQPFCALDTPPNPTSIYAATKLAQEHILVAWTQAFGASLDIARLQNVYGPGQALQNPYTGIISLFARLSKAGMQIDLYEDGQMQRDFVYIEDVVSALIAAIDQKTSGVRRFDVGLGVRHTISNAADILCSRNGSPPPQLTGRFRHGDVRHAGCRLDATYAVLDWKPQFTLEQGLNHLCDWIDSR
jgi:dTDP-L-rhamnose 4-epimerase